MFKILQVLLLGGLFYSGPIKATATIDKVLIEDTLIFMIKEQVYSISDLEELQRALEVFDCAYPDAFLPDHFELITRKFDKRVLKKKYLAKNANTKKTKVYLDEFLQYLKISIYASEQSVSVTSELKKAIRLSAQTRNCSMEFFEGNSMKSPLEMALVVEVFFRSRNVLENQDTISQKERRNILKSLASLSNSIINQISHNQFELTHAQD